MPGAREEGTSPQSLDGAWAPEALASLRVGTWAKPLAKAEERAARLSLEAEVQAVMEVEALVSRGCPEPHPDADVGGDVEVVDNVLDLVAEDLHRGVFERSGEGKSSFFLT